MFKLTDDQAREAAARFYAGESRAALAIAYHVSEQHLWSIFRGYSRKHLNLPPYEKTPAAAPLRRADVNQILASVVFKKRNFGSKLTKTAAAQKIGRDRHSRLVGSVLKRTESLFSRLDAKIDRAGRGIDDCFSWTGAVDRRVRMRKNGTVAELVRPVLVAADGKTCIDPRRLILDKCGEGLPKFAKLVPCSALGTCCNWRHLSEANRHGQK